MAATAIIGTTVTVGIMGIASAGDEEPVANEQCLPEQPPAEEPAPEEPPAEEPAPEEPPAEEPAPEEPPAEEPAPEEPPAEEPAPEEPPAEEPAPEQPPAEEPAEGDYGQTGPAAAMPPDPANQDPADENGNEEQDPPAEEPAPEEPPAEEPAPEEPPAEEPPAEEPPAECEEDLGPSPEDFVNIEDVEPSNQEVQPGEGASTGTFVSECGTNENNHNNPDNFIVAPGVRNGAEHTHDYVGNLTADANSNNESLAASGTTCTNGDLSTYYWPVVRVRAEEGQEEEVDQENPHNIGAAQRPVEASLEFRGNATGEVTAPPQFIRIITGDAKASTNGGANGRAQWTCSGFEDRLTTQYPICPEGSQLTRILDFPSCWDGENIDSANHRDHIVFPDEAGQCQEGTQAVPALRMTLRYDIAAGADFALDAFPGEKHSPVTDHGDFVNVMPEELMAQAVDCINTGQQC
ncbi:MAG TPA: DUF1996 domain-containing protein [Actinophytocola sp.]|nr:DUF1996 domain-containing protein [Actinophytocola sp.]